MRHYNYTQTPNEQHCLDEMHDAVQEGAGGGEPIKPVVMCCPEADNACITVQDQAAYDHFASLGWEEQDRDLEVAGIDAKSAALGLGAGVAALKILG